ncbi:MAG: hypothetical protein WDW38_002342 [Sanguina aurantia]
MQAIKERDASVALPLRRAHNRIKQGLILRFASGAGRLLDLCCGRGGDINKWRVAKVHHVKGVDISEAEVREAQRRFKEQSEESKEHQPQCVFEQSASLGETDLIEEQPYDVVTCMFAMHYFFINEAALDQFLRNVSINLKNGGFFINTIPDGKRVLFNLKDRAAYDSPCLKLEKRWHGPVTSFGCEYVFSIKSTVTEGDDESDGSLEYLVFTSALTAVAARHGLYPVAEYNDPHFEDLFEPGDCDVPFKHFKPDFPNSHFSLAQASGIFMAVVFQKLDVRPEGGIAPKMPPSVSNGNPRGGKRFREGN